MRARIAASAAPSDTAGSTRWRPRAAPRDRQPLQLHRKDDRQQGAEPEVRYRDAGQRQPPSTRSRPPCRATRPPAHPAECATPIANTIAAAASSTVAGCALPDRCGDRLAGAQRRAQVAARQAAEECRVLFEQRPVEPQLGPQRRRRRPADAVSPSIACAGSPGIKWMSEKTSVATPSSTGTLRTRRRARNDPTF